MGTSVPPLAQPNPDTLRHPWSSSTAAPSPHRVHECPHATTVALH